MILKVEVKDRQSLFDIALQVYVNTEGAYILAKENDLEVTDKLHAGQILSYSPDNVIDKRIVNQYKLNAIYPTTAFDFSVDGRIFDETFELTFN